MFIFFWAALALAVIGSALGLTCYLLMLFSPVMRAVNFYKAFRSYGYDEACRWDKLYYSLDITELHLLGVNELAFHKA